jgi:DNA helicase HerA-like ATPase
LGVVVGETNALQFKFMINRPLGRGFYVKVRGEGKEWILAQVEEVRRSNTAYNLAQLERPGYKEYASKEWMIADARVMGATIDGKVRMPNTPARPGEEVFLAEEKLIKGALGLSKGDMYIGMLKGYDLRVELDANTLVQKHCSILAKTGSGKSYTAAVILEGLLERGVALLIIDPHGEYHTMKHPAKQGDFSKYKVKPRGYDVQVYTPTTLASNSRADRPFRFNGLNLSAREISKMISEDSTNGQVGQLYEAIAALRAETDTYDLEDIIEQVEKGTSKSKWSLIGNLESLLEVGLFSGIPTRPEELLQRGRASVIDMTGVVPELQTMIIAKLLADLFEARKLGKVSPGMVVIEEAHNYIPERGTGKAASSSIIRTIAAEGRKFGLGLLVISQRPARVDKNVISQCNTQIIMRVTNPNDLKALSKGLEGMTGDLEEEIKTLVPGTAMLVSNEIERPVVVNIRPRKSLHGGISTPIVAKGHDVPQPGPKSQPPPRPKPQEKTPSGLLKKVFGSRGA